MQLGQMLLRPKKQQTITNRSKAGAKLRNWRLLKLRKQLAADILKILMGPTLLLMIFQRFQKQSQ